MSHPTLNLPWEACGNLIRDKLTAGGGGFLMAEVPASLGNSCARAEFIVRACNSHDMLIAAMKQMRVDALSNEHGYIVDQIDAALATAGVKP